MESRRILETPLLAPSARAELEALRVRAKDLEEQLRSEGVPEAHAPGAASQQVVNEHWGGIITPTPSQQHHETAVSLQLAPEIHDEKMGELIWMLQQKGVTSAIAAAEALNNPHLIDDFHRVLVEYVREGFPAKEASSSKYRTTLTFVLFEVTLPLAGADDKSADQVKVMRDFVALMEQFYRGMLQMDVRKGEYFSFEIANPVGSTYTTVYIAVPSTRKTLFEKQLLGIYPTARIVEKHDDYNAFVDGAVTSASSAHLSERAIFSLRTFEVFPNDPIDTMLNAFSQLSSEGEGAALQFVISPQDNGLPRRYRHALEQIRSGTPMRTATNIKTGLAGLAHEVVILFSDTKKVAEDKRPAADDPRIKAIEHKIASPLLHANIRLVASAASKMRADEILQGIEGPFHQFADTAGNSIAFKTISASRVKKFAHAFSYRLLDWGSAIPLSALELATMAHLPNSASKNAAPELRQEKSHVAPPPSDLPNTGAVLGINRFRGSTVEVRIAPEDRLRHLYVIGQTGVGKSVLLKNVILQDIQSGAGVCMIDPHGSDVLDVLSAIPRERMDDVIYFDPGSTERPMALNMLEYDVTKPEQKTLVVDELFGIFKKLFGAVPESMGPAFEQYFRNSALLVMEAPELGNTLLDISRIFADPSFRARKLAVCKNPVIKQFWEEIASKTSGDQSLENWGPYVTNKFDIFTTNEIMRPIIAQQKSSFNFRDIMDNRKILLVNLAKGRIGDINANLLGLIIVGKFLIAALSRADSVGKDLPPFYLHIDEFQNFTTPSIATIFSEARKYKLSLTVAHQFIAQLMDEIRDAVFGNVGNICAFRVGAADAEFLEKQFMPTFSQSDLMNIDNRNAYVKLLVDGRPTTPFNISTLPFPAGNMENVNQMKELSALKYGRPRADIEAEVARTFSPSSQDPSTLAQGEM